MEFLVILFFFGLSAGVVARIRGNGFMIWFMIGFCVPFLGTVAAMLYRRERDELRRRCPECAAVIPLYVQVCTRCGADLEFPEEAIAPRSATPPAD
jgi:hypothetical protein